MLNKIRENEEIKLVLNFIFVIILTVSTIYMTKYLIAFDVLYTLDQKIPLNVTIKFIILLVLYFINFIFLILINYNNCNKYKGGE